MEEHEVSKGTRTVADIHVPASLNEICIIKYLPFASPLAVFPTRIALPKSRFGTTTEY